MTSYQEYAYTTAPVRVHVLCVSAPVIPQPVSWEQPAVFPSLLCVAPTEVTHGESEGKTGSV